MIKDVVLEYGAPIAVAITLFVGNEAMENSKAIAVLEAQDEHYLEVQRELVNETRMLVKAVTRIEAKLEVQEEHNE